MKNKIMNLFNLGNSLLRERFLVSMAPGAGAPSATPGSVPDVDTTDTLAEQVTLKDLERNPYAKYFMAQRANVPSAYKSKPFKTVDKPKEGKLTLQYFDANGGIEHEFDFDGLAYKGFRWHERIVPKLDELFANNNVPKQLMVLGAEDPTNAPNFDQLVDAVTKDPDSVTVNSPLVVAALQDLERQRPYLDLATVRGLSQMKASMERQKERMGIELQENKPVLPTFPKLNKGQFLDAQKKAEEDLDQGKDNFNITRRSTLRDQLGINPRDWKITNNEELNKVYIQWSQLQIPVGEPFYSTMFFHLKDRNDKKNDKNSNLTDDQRGFYNDPENHYKDIEAFDPEYATALKAYLEVRTKLSKEVTDSEKVSDLKAGKDGVEKARETATDVLRRNYNAFAKSIREKDYVTAGGYLLGIYAVYKTYKNLTKGAEGEKYKNWLFYGSAAFAGYVFAKNAGYDLLKMAGFKYKDAEIAGTSLDITTSLGLKETEGFDSSILARIADKKVKDLNALYKSAQASDDKVKIISPEQFPDLFPELRGKRNTKEYVETGKQLFQAVVVLRAAYSKTLEPKNGITFDRAFNDDPVLQYATVEALCQQMDLYNPGRNKPAPLDLGKFKRAHETLSKAFDYADPKSGFKLENPNDKGEMAGKITGYPVVVIYNDVHERYRVYFKSVYADGKNLEKFIADIPENDEAGAQLAARKAVAEVGVKMNNLTKRLAKEGYSPVVFNGSIWTTTKDLPERVAFDLPKETATFEVKPNSEGTDVSLEMQKDNTSIVMDEGLVKGNPDSLRLLIALISGRNNQKFRILAPFANAKMLSIYDIKDSNPNFGDVPTFELKLNDINENFVIKYDQATQTYEFADPAKEKELKDNPTFKEKLVALSMNDRQITSQVETFKLLLKDVPKSYAMNLLQHLPSWFTEATSGDWLNGFKKRHLTGSIAKDYVGGYVDAQVAFTQSRMLTISDTATDLEDLSRKFEGLKRGFVDGLAGTNDTLRQLVAKGENVSEADFDKKITSKINTLGMVSTQYKEWYTKYVAVTFDKYGGDEFSEANTKKAIAAISAFAYYTAPLDNRDLDGVNLNAPRSNAAEFARAENYRKHVNYLNYAVQSIDEKMEADSTNLPQSPDGWGLTKFENFIDQKFDGFASRDAIRGLDTYDKFDVTKPNTPDTIFREDLIPAGLTDPQLDALIEAANRKTELEYRFEDLAKFALDNLLNANIDNVLRASLDPAFINDAKSDLSDTMWVTITPASGAPVDFYFPLDASLIPTFKKAYAASGAAIYINRSISGTAIKEIDQKLQTTNGALNSATQNLVIEGYVRQFVKEHIIDPKVGTFDVPIKLRILAWWDSFSLFN